MHHRLMTAAGVLLLPTFLLAGCAPGPEPRHTTAATAASTPDAQPTAEPTELLAIATETYSRYLAVYAQVLNEGGAAPERLDDVALDELSRNARETAAWMQQNQIHGTGATTFDNAVLLDHAADDSGRETITMSVCLDVSAAGFVSADGSDAVSSTRQDRRVYTVTVTSDDPPASPYRVENEDAQPGGGSC